jgi:hypothetical protein
MSGQHQCCHITDVIDSTLRHISVSAYKVLPPVFSDTFTFSVGYIEFCYNNI